MCFLPVPVSMKENAAASIRSGEPQIDHTAISIHQLFVAHKESCDIRELLKLELEELLPQ